MVSVSARLPHQDLIEEDLQGWVSILPEPTDKETRKRLVEAARISFDCFRDKKERTGQLVALYTLHVADILALLDLDDDTLTAAILYRCVIDGCVDDATLEKRFHPQVAGMARDLIRIHRLSPGVLGGHADKSEENAENIRRMLLGISQDVRVVIILLAERLHLMRRLQNLAEEQQQLFARNTRDIFAPIANRLGIWQIKWELEDLSLRYIEPDAYRRIATQLEGRRGERLAFIDKMISILTKAFEKEGITAEISGRPKHIYSIWKKMQRKDAEFEHIFDIRAVRIMVDSVADCYGALGVVHTLWRHIPKEFDDYIATPKANLYKSIHTVVIGPDERPLEIQIRTHEMHAHAEHGVAAHWRYKEQKRMQSSDLERRIEWMRQWLEHRELGEAEADKILAEDVHNDYEQSRVYVLTPQGKVIELPHSSTALDFAYAIHTSIGHRCRGARADGRIIPLNQPLESGQTVEILTTKNESPSRDWLSPHLGYLHSDRAKNRVRQWFRQQDYDSHVELGKASLERELTRLGITRPDLAAIAPKFNFQGADDLYAAIGRGDVSPVQVATWETREAPTKKRPSKRRRKPVSKDGSPRIVVEGVDDLMTNLGRCCKPVPSDPIIGYITRGHGVTIHRKSCPIITHMNEEDRARLVDVYWSSDSGGSFTVDIRIIAADRKGLLRDVSAVFSNEEIDVTSVKTHSDRKKNQAVMRISAEIQDVSELSRVLDKLQQVPDVIETSRITT